MIVVKSQDIEAVPSKEGNPMVAQGPIRLRRLFDPASVDGTGIVLVTFDPGTRFNFHVHTDEQIIFVTEGKGILATRDKEYVVTPGMVVYIPAGEEHWHGATADSSFTHLAIHKGGTDVVD